MPRILFYKVIFEPAEEGGYTVYVPALKGCISEGDTYEEAHRNIKDAIQLYVDTLKDRGREIPEDSHHIAEVECLV